MDEATYGVKDGEHIPGETVHRYLTDVAKKTGVFERTRFGQKLESVTARDGDQWTLQVSDRKCKTQTIHTKKLIVATGLTSTPNMPRLPGQESFDGPIFHTKDFNRQRHTLDTAKHVVIAGGSKSAYDVAWAYCKAGAQVDIVIRPDGNGPVWMSPALVTPLKRPLECLLHTRALSWFSPCPFGDEDGWVKTRRWLHSTWLGRAITNVFWKSIASDVLASTGWDRHPETKKLTPWNTTFWTGTALGILNYDGDWMELVRTGKVRVNTVDITKIGSKKVYLGDGTALGADVLVCATGWLKEPSVKFLDITGADCELGLSFSEKEQERLKSEADDKVLKMFPRLKDQPEIGPLWKEKKPYRLYRFMVPPGFVEKRNIAFAGQVSTLSNPA